MALSQLLPLVLFPRQGHGIGPDHERNVTGNHAQGISKRDFSVQFVEDRKVQSGHSTRFFQKGSCRKDERWGGHMDGPSFRLYPDLSDSALVHPRPHDPPHEKFRAAGSGLLQEVHAQLLGTEPPAAPRMEHGYGRVHDEGVFFSNHARGQHQVGSIEHRIKALVRSGRIGSVLGNSAVAPKGACAETRDLLSHLLHQRGLLRP